MKLVSSLMIRSVPFAQAQNPLNVKKSSNTVLSTPQVIDSITNAVYPTSNVQEDINKNRCDFFFFYISANISGNDLKNQT